MKLTKNNIALLALLMMFVSISCNIFVYQKASIQITGKVTQAYVMICINTPPLLSMSCSNTATVNLAYSCDADATDSDNANSIIQNLTFSDNTSLFNINPSTGVIQFTPNSSQIGNYSIRVMVEDNTSCANSVDSEILSLTISEQVVSCGNNIKETGEECDGNDLGGESCTSKGYDGGTLKCNTFCTFNTNDCYYGTTPAPAIPEAPIEPIPQPPLPAPEAPIEPTPMPKPHEEKPAPLKQLLSIRSMIVITAISLIILIGYYKYRKCGVCVPLRKWIAKFEGVVRKRERGNKKRYYK